MTKSEYEQKKRECWEEFMRSTDKIITPRDAFLYAFDRAYALGKQDKDADTVISGWVARDEGRFLGLYSWQPKRSDVAWIGDSCMVLPINTFPDLTWESEPEPVEIIIKRKKNGRT